MTTGASKTHQAGDSNSGGGNLPVGAVPFHVNASYLVAQTDTQIVAAPGAGVSIYITDVTMGTDTAMSMTLVSNTPASADEYGPWPFADNGGLAKPQETPIILPANQNLGITTSAAGIQTVSVQGYTL